MIVVAAATGVADVLVALFVVLLAAKLGDEFLTRFGAAWVAARPMGRANALVIGLGMARQERSASSSPASARPPASSRPTCSP